jgi:hypothetical protein
MSRKAAEQYCLDFSALIGTTLLQLAVWNANGLIQHRDEFLIVSVYT